MLGKKKVKQIHDVKNSAIAKFQNLIGKAIFVCPGKPFTNYNVSRGSSGSVERHFYILLVPKGAIGKLQILLVFLEHQVQL